MAEPDIWSRCVSWLEQELTAHEIGLWIRPLRVARVGQRLVVSAPNRMAAERVRSDYAAPIQRAWLVSDGADLPIEVVETADSGRETANGHDPGGGDTENAPSIFGGNGRLDPSHTFASFIQGKQNQQARAASLAVSDQPGWSFNPLLIYGASGLGKTHLMHAIGNAILAANAKARVVYVGSEQWVNQFVSALRHNNTEAFKRYYRTVDALLIDDIQFFAGKAQSQEEFFHTFNSLMDGRKQIVMTCDRFPKELDRLEERLKSRFTWGLTVSVEPPDLETRVAILLSKAEGLNLDLTTEVAFFIAQHVRSNVRELEGALLRLSAGALLQGVKTPTMDFTRQVLRDMLVHFERQVTIDNIMGTVGKYFNIPAKELRSPRRTRSLARPRQIAMSLARELTSHSLPEIGAAFEKDHTTVIHACRTIAKLRLTDTRLDDDYENLLKQLSF